MALERGCHGVEIVLWKDRVVERSCCGKMAAHFSANQYEQAFAAQRLQNWEVPMKFKERPSTLEGFTQPISNNRGHILPGIPRSQNSPWGDFVGTWDLSKSLSRSKQMKAKTSKDTSPEEMPNSLESKDDKPKPVSPSANEQPTSPRAKDVPSPEAKTRASPVANEQRNSPRAATPENVRASPATGSPTRDKASNETSNEKLTSVC